MQAPVANQPEAEITLSTLVVPEQLDTNSEVVPSPQPMPSNEGIIDLTVRGDGGVENPVDSPENEKESEDAGPIPATDAGQHGEEA